MVGEEVAMSSRVETDPGHLQARLTAMVRRANVEHEPAVALDHLCLACVEMTCASAGRIYVLDLANSAYVLHDPERRPAGDRRAFQVSLLEPAEKSLLRRAIDGGRSCRVPQIDNQPRYRVGLPDALSRMIIPILRDRTCLGVIDLDSIEPDHFTADHQELVEMAAQVALMLLEKGDTLNLLEKLQRPIKFDQPENDFLDALMLLIAEASRMPIITLRELREDTLYCRRSFGLGGKDDEEMHLSPFERFPMFARAVSDRTVVVERDMAKPEVRQLLEHLHQVDQSIQSICVVPILTGERVFGTLSFAVKCAHDYTNIEVNGLRTIANAVGVSYVNYRNFQKVSADRFEMARVGAAIMTMEVSQAVRHEARTLLDAAQTRMGNLKHAYSGRIKGDEEAKFKEDLDKIKDLVFRSSLALQKIKTASKPPDREYKLVSLRDLWREAFDLVSGHLGTERISFDVKGNAEAKVYSEFLRFAFLNIISNSIDAFQEARKQNRRIDVEITTFDRANDVTIRYNDNGPGIDPSKLKSLDDETLKLTPESIFEHGVTSKKEGSGYGMYLVRKAITDHKGSIYLRSHRNGVNFEILLPKDKNRR
jgi:signal transduction histidine kinase